MSNDRKWGFYAAVGLAVLNGLASLWLPMPHLLVAVCFAAMAAGIRNNQGGAALGGAGLALVMGLGLASHLDARQSGIVELLIYGGAAWVMFRARAGGLLSLWILPSAVMTLFYGLFTVYAMPTSSMEKTLLAGDQLMMPRFGGKGAQRGDIVIFREPQRGAILIKRVVAVGGDTVKIVNRELYVNQQKVKEPYVTHVAPYEVSMPVRDEFPAPIPDPVQYLPWAKALEEMSAAGVVTVPANAYFVLGDNRDNSLDSRYFGFIAAPDVMGRPLTVLFSAEGTRDDPMPAMLNPSRVRWGRILHRIE